MAGRELADARKSQKGCGERGARCLERAPSCGDRASEYVKNHPVIGEAKAPAMCQGLRGAVELPNGSSTTALMKDMSTIPQIRCKAGVDTETLAKFGISFKVKDNELSIQTHGHHYMAGSRRRIVLDNKTDYVEIERKEATLGREGHYLEVRVYDRPDPRDKSRVGFLFKVDQYCMANEESLDEGFKAFLPVRDSKNLLGTLKKRGVEYKPDIGCFLATSSDNNHIGDVREECLENDVINVEVLPEKMEGGIRIDIQRRSPNGSSYIRHLSVSSTGRVTWDEF